MISKTKLFSAIALGTLAHASLAADGSPRTLHYVDDNTTTINLYITNRTGDTAELIEAHGREVDPEQNPVVSANQTLNFTSENPFHFSTFLQPLITLTATYTYAAGDKVCEFTTWTKAKYEHGGNDGIRTHFAGTARSVGEEEADCSTLIHAVDRTSLYSSAVEFFIQ